MAAINIEPPVLYNDAEKDSGLRSKNRLRIFLVILLSVAILFQFIAIVTPGWNIVVSVVPGNTFTAYSGLYYNTACTNTTCQTKSKLHAYQKATENAKSARTVRAYNLAVHFQIDVQLAWFGVLATFVFQLVKTLQGREWPRLNVISGIVITVSNVFMLERIYDAFVDIAYSRLAIDYSGRDDSYVSFPYSLFFYILSFGPCFASCVLIWLQLITYMNGLSQDLASIKIKAERDKHLFEAERDKMNRQKKDYEREHGDKRHSDSMIHHEDVHLRVSRDASPRTSGRHSDYRNDRHPRGPPRSPRHSPRHSPPRSPRRSPPRSSRSPRQSAEMRHDPHDSHLQVRHDRDPKRHSDHADQNMGGAVRADQRDHHSNTRTPRDSGSEHADHKRPESISSIGNDKTIKDGKDYTRVTQLSDSDIESREHNEHVLKSDNVESNDTVVQI